MYTLVTLVYTTPDNGITYSWLFLITTVMSVHRDRRNLLITPSAPVRFTELDRRCCRRGREVRQFHRSLLSFVTYSITE